MALVFGDVSREAFRNTGLHLQIKGNRDGSSQRTFLRTQETGCHSRRPAPPSLSDPIHQQGLLLYPLRTPQIHRLFPPSPLPPWKRWPPSFPLITTTSLLPLAMILLHPFSMVLLEHLSQTSPPWFKPFSGPHGFGMRSIRPSHVTPVILPAARYGFLPSTTFPGHY